MVLVLMLLLVLSAVPAVASSQEAPMLAERVAAGELPPVEERLPLAEDLYVVDPIEEIGRYGGTMRLASIRPEAYGDDTLIMAAPIMFMKPDPEDLSLIPHIPREITVSEDSSTFTIHMRRGMKWSDGVPYNADDIMFWYNDVLYNDELTPVIGQQWRDADGEVVEVTAIDDYTVEFRFGGPKPFFLNDLVHIWFHFHPAHYLQQFHPNYVDRAELDAMVAAEGFDTWIQLFSYKHNEIWGTPNSLEIPTIAPYIQVVKTSDRRVYERNPYYWKVDTEGNQLPYIDRIEVTIASDLEVIQGMILSGQLDFSGVGTDIRNFPMYRSFEEEGGYRTMLWNSGMGSDVIYMFNMTHEDPYLREVFGDARFRRAMSLAIDRQEISDVIYFGRAVPRQYTVVPESRYYDPAFESAYVEYDPDTANALLDEIGLTGRDSEGFRLLPNGQRLTFTIEYFDTETPKGPNIEIVAQHWNEVGIDVRSRSISGELQGQRTVANLMDATVWHGDKATDVLFPLQSQFFVPHNPGWERTKWPQWGHWFASGGEDGEEPPEQIKELRGWWDQMMVEPDPERQIELGKLILQAQAENLWVIGTVGEAPHPVLVNQDLRNVPEFGLFVWDAMYIAAHDPEQLFFDR